MTVCLFNIQHSSGLVINIHVRVSTYCYDVYTHESNLTCDLISTLIQEMDIYFACSVIVNNCPVVSLISSEYVYLAWSARDYSIHVMQLVAYACQWACLRHQSNLGLFMPYVRCDVTHTRAPAWDVCVTPYLAHSVYAQRLLERYSWGIALIETLNLVTSGLPQTWFILYYLYILVCVRLIKEALV